jgi:allantoate deiminase
VSATSRPAGFDIDADLVAHCINEMAQYGAYPTGGMQRLVYTRAWREAVAHYVRWLEHEGLHVRQDAVGNVFGVASGREPGPSIVTGSHIDTALRGGKYDGTLGVIAGYVALRTLLRAVGQPRRTLEALAICDEEASRFHSNFWGSRAIAGFIQPGEAETIFDAEGVSLADAMRSCDLDPSRIATARRDDIDTFIELHIEQGPLLEQKRIPVGVVEAITAIEQVECTVQGRADHAGGCPMDARLDPMIAVAQMVLEVTRLAKELGPPAVATVGRIVAEPGSPNIVAAEVRFTIDARYPDAGKHEQLMAHIGEACRAIAAAHGLGLRMARLTFQPPTASSPDLVRVISEAAGDLGLPHLTMVSGAGHDTQVLARRGVRRAMIFVPSRAGRSHSPDEFTAIEDIVAGIAVLAEVLYRLAY